MCIRISGEIDTYELIRDEEHMLSQTDNKYEIVATTMYLLGIEREFAEKSENDRILEIYDEVSKDKSARIIHYLCLARATLERNFGRISSAMKSGSSIYSSDETIKDCINKLYKEGIEIFGKNTRDLNEYVIEANRYISDRINNCRNLYPDWLKWDYMRDFFVMPGGLSAGGVQAEGKKFQDNRFNYPFQTYCNWPVSEQGNILSYDRKFVNLMYSWHEDEFVDKNKVSDVAEHTKDKIYKFIGNAIRVVAVVDCENSDPYRLLSAFTQLNEEYVGRVASIILIDDDHTTAAWELFEQHVGVPVQHIVVDRLLEHKSMVDLSVCMKINHEHYVNHTDGFILVASDSDYWTIIKELDTASFLVMSEREKISPTIKAKLLQSDVFYCYIDDFYSGANEELQRQVITKELKAEVAGRECGNLSTMLRNACYRARVDVNDEEFRRMYAKAKQALKVNVSDEGEITLELSFKGNI